MTNEQQKSPGPKHKPAKAPIENLERPNPEGQHEADHREEALRASKGPPPEQQRENNRENQSGKGSGEGTTGMQRGAGHPTGR